ncbi:MAG: glycosyltransferase family 2 protein [bacterium]
MEKFLLYSYAIVLLFLSVFGFHRFYMIHIYRKFKSKVRKPLKKFENLPKVCIQLPVFNEKYVVERLIDKVAQMRYPQELLEIQVLDDSTDETVEISLAACERVKSLGVNIKQIRRPDRVGFKAGALEYGQNLTDAEFIAVFDADFLPSEDFLERTIDFFTDPEIGMVQARWDHINRNFSILTEVQSILLDGHFMIEHTFRNRSGRFFNFNGTAGIWRKSTIIEAGGWHHDTITEDLDLSYRAQLKGWKFVYLPELTVPAELPVEISSFKSQQFRWAKGSIQVFKKLYPQIVTSKNISFKVKLEAFFHLGANFAYMLMVLLCILMPLNIATRMGHGILEVILFDLPVFIFATFSVVFFYLFSEVAVINETLTMKGKSKLTPLIYIPFTISIGIGLAINNSKAVVEALLGKKTDFIRTPKYDVLGKITSKSEFRKKVSLNKYRFTNINIASIIELLFAIYFSWTLYFAFDKGFYFSIPFIFLFQFGFLYTAFLSLFHTPLMKFWNKEKSLT